MLFPSSAFTCRHTLVATLCSCHSYLHYEPRTPRRRCLRLTLCGLVSVLLIDCGGTEAQLPLMGAETEGFCQSPQGFFANTGKPIDAQQNYAPTLSSLLWAGDLPASGVDRLELETLDDDVLRITPWVENRRLEEVLELNPESDDCSDGRWRFTTSWDGLLLDGVIAGLLWTGGAVLPAARRDEYRIHFTDDGDLAVHYQDRTAGAFFFFFPMYMKSDKAWFVYERTGLPASMDSLPLDVSPL